MAESATYQPPLPIEEFTETVTYSAKTANADAYDGWEITHHTVKATAINALPDPNLQRALQIQLNLTRSEGMLYLPVCDENHVLTHSVSVPQWTASLIEPAELKLSGDEVLPIFAIAPPRNRLLAWAGKLLSR